jgi:hypothetical protein
MKNNAESIHNSFSGYPERKKALERLKEELDTKQRPIINKYIKQLFTPFPLTLTNYFEDIYTQTDKPDYSEPLATYSKRRVQQSEAKLRKSEIKNTTKSLEDAIKVKDRPNISKSLRKLSSLSSPLSPELCDRLADYLDPDSSGGDMGPKPRAPISLPARSIFRLYKYLFNNKEAARWALNAERKEFHVLEDTILLDDNVGFSPEWRFPEMKRSRNQRYTPDGKIIEENVCALFNIKSRAFSAVRARTNEDIIVFHNNLRRMEKFPPELIGSLIFALYFVTPEQLTKMLHKK